MRERSGPEVPPGQSRWPGRLLPVANTQPPTGLQTTITSPVPELTSPGGRSVLSSAIPELEGESVKTRDQPWHGRKSKDVRRYRRLTAGAWVILALSMLTMFGVLLLLGMFMDQISIMLLTIPVFFPLAAAMGFDKVWFGIVVLLALQMSLTTPPFGLLLFGCFIPFQMVLIPML